MNVPVPPVFLNEDQYGQYSVIDGKQRLTAIQQFLRGNLVLQGLEIFSDINGLSFNELPNDLQTVFRTRPTLRAVIILRQSDSDIKFEVFQRLNTGGVWLNPQEIRNSTYPGPLNDLILEMSEEPSFHRLLGIEDKTRSDIYLEMRDAEFVLRFLTFRAVWPEFQGGMKQSMDRFMQNNQKLSNTQIKRFQKEFLGTLKVVESVFEDHAFQRWVPQRGTWRSQVLASLFDAQMFACVGLDFQRLERRKKTIIESYKALFDHLEFRKSIDAATNTPSFFRRRIEIVRNLLTAT